MSGREPTRQDDEQLLDMLGARFQGVSSYQIAASLAMTPGKVRTMTNRVRDDDERFGGEDTTSAYW